MKKKTPQTEPRNNIKNTKPKAREKAVASEAISGAIAQSTRERTVAPTEPEGVPVYHVGLDVHAADFTAAIAEPGRGEIRELGTFTSDLHALEKLMQRLKKAHAGAVLHVAYEAGPTGFVFARRLAQLGIGCTVAAPSLMPQRPGERIKTDRRDAKKIARLSRAGELVACYVPDASDEAIRDLCRARTDAVEDTRRCKSQLKALLLRNGYRYTGKANWSAAHLRYLRELVMAHPAQKMTLEEYIMAITAAEERTARCEEAMRTLLPEWRRSPAVKALMACRGFALIASMITVSELGDCARFAHPSELMAYLGLVPGERSSGGSRRQSGITKTGNGHLRWIMVESALHYALAPKVSKELSARQEGQSKEVIELSWKMQTRLYARRKKLAARLMLGGKIQVALARELTGFIWAMLRKVSPLPEALAPLEVTPAA